MSGPPELELVDVVDEAGEVVDTVTRAEVRAGNLRHRSVFVVVVDSAERLVVHRRADWKDLWPGFWDVAFGGVLGAGEAWEDGAARELAEEAGVVGVALELLGEGSFDDERVSERARIYRARSDGPYTTPDGEVAEIDLVPLADLARWLVGRSVTPDSRSLVLPLLGP